MKSPIEIHRMATAHLAACAQIDSYCAAPGNRWIQADFADFISWPGQVGLVAMFHDEILGFILVQGEPTHRQVAILRLGIARHWQRRRIGSQLVQFVRAKVPDWDLRAVVHERWLGMQCFLRANGFRALHICKRCYDDDNDGYLFELARSRPARRMDRIIGDIA